MELFDDYELQFYDVSRNVNSKLFSLSFSAGERRKTTINEIEKDIEKAEQILQNMDL